MFRQTFRWNWPITLYMQVVISYCMICSYNFMQYSFTTQPMHAAVTEGETVSLKCAWKPELRDGHVLKWTHFDLTGFNYQKQVEENTQYSFLNEPNSSTLWISSFSGTDTGSYRCEILGHVTSDFAKVSMLTCNPETDEGELDDFVECYSTYDSFDLQWFRNGEPLNEKQQSPISTRPRALSTEDDGVEFTCQATYNNLEIGRCTTAPLILPDPWIKKTPRGSIHVGDKFNLTCLVNGNSDKYKYRWKFRNQDVINKVNYAIGENEYVLAFSNVINNYNKKIVTCTVTRANRVFVASFRINITITTEMPVTTTATTANLNTNRIHQSPTIGNKESQGSAAPVIYIVIGVVTVILVIVTTILIICLLAIRRKNRYNNVTKHESVPLEDSSYEAIKERPTSTESRRVSETNPEKNPIREQLIPDSTLYHEPRALNSRPTTNLNNSENLYAEPAMATDDSDSQFGSSSQVVSYDTPRKTVSLDNLDDHSKQGTSLKVENMSELYATPSKTLSRESIDEMYAKPNKTPSRSIDELYSKPNKLVTNTPKSSREDLTQKNVEGLTYADIEFQNGTFPSPEPKDYGLEYASVQFNS